MKKISILLCILFVQACAFTDSKLAIQHTDDAHFKGPIENVGPLIFIAPELKDKRLDVRRIGWKKNGYGQNTANITSIKPVQQIISDGINAGLVQNGHSILNNGRIKIVGDINQFWFDQDVNFWTVEFLGDIKATLSFIDTTNNKVIHTGDYSGAYSDKSALGLEKTWTDVMNKTVNNLVEDIMFDDDLIEALEELL